MRSLSIANTLLVLSVVSVCCSPLLAQQNDRTRSRRGNTDPVYEYYRAFYLQHEKGDLKEAAKSYERALGFGAKGEVRDAIRANQAILQEDLAVNDFAQVMPADAFAYLQISRPAHHLEEIAHMMGLTGKTFDEDYRPEHVDLDGMVLSSDFQLSPALLRELKKIRGAAVAISDINQRGEPVGVAIIHPGDSDLVTGLVETGIQLVPSGERIGGFQTFQVEREVWIVKTTRLIIVSTDKSRIENCLAQLKQGPSAETASLANTEAFQAARKEHGDAAVFAFVDPKSAMEKLGSRMGREAMIAKMVLDIDHMQFIAGSITSTDQGVRARVQASMQEGHNSLAYGLIRTVPLSRKALSHVPQGSAAVVGLGLNPKLVMAAEAAADSHVTALDIGRELFANIEEVGAFVWPETVEGNQQFPEFGIVFAANDVDKSEALWHQLLSLPEQLQMDDGPKSQPVSIDGVEGRQYVFPGTEMPDLIVAKLNEDTMIAGTKRAVTAAIKAGQSGQTFVESQVAQPLWDSSSESTAKAVLVHAGRVISLVGAMDNAPPQQVEMMEQAFGELTLTLVSNESARNFELQLDATNLPQFESIVKTASKMNSTRNARSDRTHKKVHAPDTEAAERVEMQER